jgi:hypothetical protein
VAAAGNHRVRVVDGAIFIGQQFLRTCCRTPLAAGAAILPAAVLMVIVAPRSAALIEARGSRFTLLLGYAFCFGAFVTMLLLWKDGAAYWTIALGYSFMGVGVGLAGTPASRSLTGSVPVTKAGMASGTADLQRDLGGAVVQSVLGALLTAGYAAAFAKAIANNPNGDQISQDTQNALEKSFSSAANVAEQYPQYATQITGAAKESFVSGQTVAYLAGGLAVAAGAAIVWFFFPDKDDERALLAEYHAQDANPT